MRAFFLKWREKGRPIHFILPPTFIMLPFLLVVAGCSNGTNTSLEGPVRAEAAEGEKNEKAPFTAFVPPERIKVEKQDGFKREWDRRTFSHELLEKVLKRVVNEKALVDYQGLRKDSSQLDEYLYRLQETDPSGLASKAGRFAFWLNAYNACTLKLMIEVLPKDVRKWERFSLIAAKPSAWESTSFILGGKQKTLNGIEHGVLRKPPFADPRIHAAVNCASMSCPKLHRFAFLPEKLEGQLDFAAADWCNDPDRNRLEGRTLFLSKIFEWYGEDFKAGGGSVAFMARYLRDKKSKALLLSNQKPEIKFLEYSWALNKK